jgi:Arc/MetJ family transcription regulator
MKHTSLYLEEELLTEAAETLGTTGPTGTVRAALEDVVRRARLQSLAEWEIELQPEELEELRRPRLDVDST